MTMPGISEDERLRLLFEKQGCLVWCETENSRSVKAARSKLFPRQKNIGFASFQSFNRAAGYARSVACGFGGDVEMRSPVVGLAVVVSLPETDLLGNRGKASRGSAAVCNEKAKAGQTSAAVGGSLGA